MDIQAEIAKGIQAAQNGDKVNARKYFYDVLDIDPRNETAWLWLSYVVDNVDDRQICLENVLTLNPNSAYAQEGLAQLNHLVHQATQVIQPIKIKQNRPKRPALLVLVSSFWLGLGVLFLTLGLFDTMDWGLNWFLSRTFPDITPFQLFNLVGAFGFLIFGILATNVAWALFMRYRLGYFISIVGALGLILTGPTAAFILESPNYLVVFFMALMPTIILFLTLMSQTGFDHDQQLAPHPKRN